MLQTLDLLWCHSKRGNRHSARCPCVYCVWVYNTTLHFRSNWVCVFRSTLQRQLKHTSFLGSHIPLSSLPLLSHTPSPQKTRSFIWKNTDSVKKESFRPASSDNALCIEVRWAVLSMYVSTRHFKGSISFFACVWCLCDVLLVWLICVLACFSLDLSCMGLSVLPGLD